MTSISGSVTLLRDFMFYFDVKQLGIMITFTLINYDEWNLLGLTIMVFFLNQLIATSDAHSKFDIKFPKLSKIESMILSSGKLLILLISVYLIHRNKSLMKILKRIGPKIEPCGTHNKVSKICFILLVFCLCLFRWYECRNTIQQYIQDQ